MALITPERYMLSLRKTPVILNALLHGVTQEQAQQLTDGPGGWNVVEAMCHIRDSADITLTRAQRILSEDHPLLPNFDPTAHAEGRNYATQNLAAEFAAYLDARKQLVALLEGITAEQWQRQGTHSHYGDLTLLELMVFAEWHDVNHIEQIARTLTLSDALL
jgi:hypothetical protein